MARCGAGADSDAIRGEPLCHVAHCTWPGTEFSVRGSYPCKESLRMERGEWARLWGNVEDSGVLILSSTTLANNSIGNNLDSFRVRNAWQSDLSGFPFETRMLHRQIAIIISNHKRIHIQIMFRQ